MSEGVKKRRREGVRGKKQGEKERERGKGRGRGRGRESGGTLSLHHNAVVQCHKTGTNQ